MICIPPDQNVGLFLTTREEMKRPRIRRPNFQRVDTFVSSEREKSLLDQLNEQASSSLIECMGATKGTELIKQAAQGKTSMMNAVHAALQCAKASPQLIEDAMDTEGQTISHWDEDSGSTRW
jgi:hypothetical protein